MQLTAATIFLALSLSTITLSAPANTDSGDAYAVCYSLDECYYLDSDYGNQNGQSGPGPFSYSDVAAAGEYYGYSNDNNGDENDTENDNDTTNDNDNDLDNENDNNNNGRRDIHDASRRHPWFLHPHHHKNNRRAIPIGAIGLNVTAGADTNITANANGTTIADNSTSLNCCAEVLDIDDILSGVTSDITSIITGIFGALGSTSTGFNLSSNDGLDLSGRDPLDFLDGLSFGVGCTAANGSDISAQCNGTLATCNGGILDIDGLTEEFGEAVTVGCQANGTASN